MSLPYINEAHGEYHSIESARECLGKFMRGEYHLMFTGLQTSEYEKSLEKLNKEAARAGHIEQCKTGIDAMISAAQQKAARQAESANKKSMDIFR